ncbi:MAG TPA: S8/S53 family peptidase [Thermoanaerobaculia bacterium]|jgi:hypothetical protein|nr:S8/S53 family peptidase [Thermoanaerobaculia bacterium]
MRRPHLFWIAAWAAIGLSACATLPQRPSRPPDLDASKACADWRWIGISRPGALCPEVSGWTVRPLFPQIPPPETDCSRKDEKVPDPEVFRELNRFCVYERASRHGSPSPPAASDLVRVDRDCAALSLSAAPLEASIAGPPFESFFEQVGKPPQPLKIDNWLGVRLAFLDTEPTHEGVPETMGNSAHGYVLSRIARKLVCTPEPVDHCAVQIATRLALPMLSFDAASPKRTRIDSKRGGFLGTQSDLASAIEGEVREWLVRKAQPHLVLNLSIAWDGRLFGGLDEAQISEMTAGTQAVYRALEYAAGYDVLVLAAAGNQKREPCASTGPLLPAAWERGGLGESCRTSPGPLVYAVGGVDSAGNPVINARPGGMPPRAAFGQVSDWGFVGSSVSTAVVSSIAALVWDSFPDLDSHGVMKILEQSGEPLSYPPDFWFGSDAPATAPFPKAHRIALCTALQGACKQHPGVPCPLQGACPDWTPDPSDVARNALVAVHRDGRMPGLGVCQPWLSPQPEDDPCLACIKPPPQ